MAQEKKQVEAITARDVDFAQWFTDVVKKAELIDYSSVKGMFILRPYAIWENMQAILDAEFKKLGHENVYMPMLIPESLLQKEKDHVEGFAPECAWVTMGGSEKLEDRLCVRPRKIFDLPGGEITEGAEADLTVLDLNRPHTIDPATFRSMGRATPFDGWGVRAGVAMTICGGKPVYADLNRQEDVL